MRRFLLAALVLTASSLASACSTAAETALEPSAPAVSSVATPSTGPATVAKAEACAEFRRLFEGDRAALIRAFEATTPEDRAAAFGVYETKLSELAGRTGDAELKVALQAGVKALAEAATRLGTPAPSAEAKLEALTALAEPMAEIEQLCE